MKRRNGAWKGRWAAVKFNEIADIFEVAVRIERHSVELYLNLFRAVRSSRAKELFSILAAAEEKHLGQFRLLLERAAAYVPRYAYPGEYELFVDGMASRTLESFRDPERPLTAPSAVEALGIAMELETGVISFYSGFIGQFAGEDRRRVEELVAEEKEHLALLEELLRTYPEAGEGRDTGGEGSPG